MFTKKDIEEVKNIILREIILFGSYSRNENNDTSDLDLMILTEEKMKVILRLHKAFLLKDFNIDLLLKNRESYDRYRNYIGTINYDVSREGTVLWTKH